MRMWLINRVLGALISVGLSFGAAFAQNQLPDFPRLAMWWPDSTHQDPQDLARYDWIAWGDWDDPDRVRAIAQLNPAQLHFMSATLTETSWAQWQQGSDEYNPEMARIPSEWFLTQRGTELLEAIDASSRTIRVTQVVAANGDVLFAPGDTVTCEFETMQVTGVNRATNTLTVNRGFVRAAAPHAPGTRIAPQITFWPGSWVMNLALDSPKFDLGDGMGAQTWLDFALPRFLPKGDWDGYVIDRIEGEQSWLVPGWARSIDPDFSNRVITDYYAAFDAAWQAGVKIMLRRVKREVFVGKPTIINSLGAYARHVDGTIFEGFPGLWDNSKTIPYADWLDVMAGLDGYLNTARGATFSLIETYEDDEMPEGNLAYRNPFEGANFIPNYRKMRFGLTTALLADGYFSYEINTNGHGSLGLMWFDEYDNVGAGRGYLGQPTSAAFQIATPNGQAVWLRDFDYGRVISNPSDKAVSLTLPTPYRHISGRQDPSVNTGQVVETVTIAAKDGLILLAISTP